MAIDKTATALTQREGLESSSWFAVVRAYLECTRRYTQMLQAFDLTVTQFDVLNTIAKLGDQAMPKAIAEAMVVTRGNVTGVLHRLRDRGLLTTREQPHDARSFVCELTPQGMRTLERARAAASRFITEQLAPFADAELRDTEQLMVRMRAHLQTLDPAAIAYPDSKESENET
jgi:DNA-binding MarR family transcriptional regulator